MDTGLEFPLVNRNNQFTHSQYFPSRPINPLWLEFWGGETHTHGIVTTGKYAIRQKGKKNTG